jgi:UrcA family protein
MPKQSLFAYSLLIMAAELVAVPLAAQEPTVVTGKNQPPIQERVNIGDLDLRSGTARQALKLRVSRAADRLCAKIEGAFPENEVGLGSPFSCSEQIYNDTRPQILVAINRARAGQSSVASLTIRIRGAKS